MSVGARAARALVPLLLAAGCGPSGLAAYEDARWEARIEYGINGGIEAVVLDVEQPDTESCPVLGAVATIEGVEMTTVEDGGTQWDPLSGTSPYSCDGPTWRTAELDALALDGPLMVTVSEGESTFEIGDAEGFSDREWEVLDPSDGVLGDGEDVVVRPVVDEADLDPNFVLYVGDVNLLAIPPTARRSEDGSYTLSVVAPVPPGTVVLEVWGWPQIAPDTCLGPTTCNWSFYSSFRTELASETG